jgi:hypothetical protein
VFWCKGGVETYQVSKRIQFLAHERRLLPPSRNLAIHEVESETKGNEAEGQVQVGVVGGVGLDAVAERGEDGHDAAEACTLVSAGVLAL